MEIYTYKNTWLLAFIFICVQGSVFAAARLRNENQTETRMVIQKEILDNSLPVENPKPNDTSSQSNSGVVNRRRITPIMFMNIQSENNTCSNTQDDFPNFFTDEQRKAGAIIVSFLVGIYCFTLLAIICDNYFLPCVERICESLNLSKDVAAATFMAMATSAPELFVNIIGTFITQSDIGIGTVVGSSMFNTLGVGALGSLAAASPIKVDWWPVTRDCTLYGVAISLLVTMTWDGRIYWYEGMILFIIYFIYFAIMFNNERISNLVRKQAARLSSNVNVSTQELTKSEVRTTKTDSVIYYIEEPIKPSSDNKKREKKEEKEPTLTEKPIKYEKSEAHLNQSSATVVYVEEPIKSYSEIKEFERGTNEDTEEKPVSEIKKLFTWPKGGWSKKVFFIYTWPIKFLLFCTIPNPNTRPKLFPITFVMCIVIIGVNSYVVSWMISIIGHTFGIPDSILGLTFLAAGACLPEALSIIIMSRKGEGSMGVSNALGANTMNILLSLGLPWFIKTMLLGDSGQAFIKIDSGTMEYTILGLIVVAFALFLTLYFNKFFLCRRTGIILIIIYLIFLSCAITTEILFIQTPSCS